MSCWAMKLVVIAVASIIYAVGISLFLDPNNLAPGGVTGISVILNRLTGAPTGTIYFLINIPIVILGIWKFGFQFMGKTAFAVMMTSFFTNLFAGMGLLQMTRSSLRGLEAYSWQRGLD